MHATTATTETPTARPKTTTRREERPTVPTGATARTAADSVIPWHAHAGIREWARRAQAANGFGDAFVD